VRGERAIKSIGERPYRFNWQRVVSARLSATVPEAVETGEEPEAVLAGQIPATVLAGSRHGEAAGLTSGNA